MSKEIVKKTAGYITSRITGFLVDIIHEGVRNTQKITSDKSLVRPKGPVKIYRVPRPGFGK